MVGLAPCSQKTFESRLALRLGSGFPGPMVVEGESRRRESDLRGALDLPAEDDIEAAETDTESEAEAAAAEPAMIDFQLQRALDLLEGVALFDIKA